MKRYYWPFVFHTQGLLNIPIFSCYCCSDSYFITYTDFVHKCNTNNNNKQTVVYAVKYKTVYYNTVHTTVIILYSKI